MRALTNTNEVAMSTTEDIKNPHANDSKVDAIAAVAVIAIIVTTLIYWLNGM